VRIGVIGLGAMGKNHARVLSKMSNVKSLSFFDPDESNGGSLFGINISADYRRIENGDFDYCVVSAPTHSHGEISLYLADIRIPTLIEKPLASSLHEADAIIKAFRTSDVLAAVGHIERYNPAVLSLKELVSTGFLGEITQISTTRVGPYSGRIRDVGVSKDLATHDIDLAAWLTGQKYSEVFAQVASPKGGAHEDVLVAIARMSDGTVATHSVNWISPRKDRLVSVTGEHGLLVADLIEQSLVFYAGGEGPTTGAQPRTDSGAPLQVNGPQVEALLREHEVFQSTLINPAIDGVVSLEEGRYALEVAERFLSSSLRSR